MDNLKAGVGVGIRVLAGLIDLAVSLFLAGLLTIFFEKYLFVIPLAMVLVLGTEMIWAVSPGKWISRIKITDASGGKAVTVQLIGRGIMKSCGLVILIGGLFCNNRLLIELGLAVTYLAFMGFAVALGRYHLALYDYLSGTKISSN